MLLRTAYHALQIRKRQQGDKAHGISAYHTEAGELVFLVVIIRHHTQQRAVRHVYCRVHRHHQQIEAVCPDTLAYRSEVRRIEQEGEDQSEGNGTEYQPGAIRTPFALRTVCQRAHQRVSHHVKHSRYQHQRGRICKRQSKHICKK